MRTYKVKAETTASASAGNLLGNTKIQERIRELMSRRQKRTEVTQDMVVKRLADLAFGNLGMICTWDQHGLVLIDSKDLSEEEIAIVSSVKVIPVSVEVVGEYTDKGKQKYQTEYRREVTQKDSLKALELLCKHLGILDGPGSGKAKDRSGAASRVVSALGRIRERVGERGSKS